MDYALDTLLLNVKGKSLHDSTVHRYFMHLLLGSFLKQMRLEAIKVWSDARNCPKRVGMSRVGKISSDDCIVTLVLTYQRLIDIVD